MPEVPQSTPPEDPHNNPGQPWIVLGGTAGALALLTTAARHVGKRAAANVAARGAAAVGASALGPFVAAAATIAGVGFLAWEGGKLIETIYPNKITGLVWRRYPPHEP